jgi:hypothetical protein
MSFEPVSFSRPAIIAPIVCLVKRINPPAGRISTLTFDPLYAKMGQRQVNLQAGNQVIIV